MNTQNSKSMELLKKVYDHLDSIDVSKLSMRELGDFLEVVQKGRFLESYGQMPGIFGPGLFTSGFNSGNENDSGPKRKIVGPGETIDCGSKTE